MYAKEVLSTFVRVNEHANGQLYDVLADGEPEFLSHARGYFGSILGTLNHVLTSELKWLNRFRGTVVDRPALEGPVVDFTSPPPGELYIRQFGELRRRRAEVDRAMCRFVDELDDATLWAEVEYAASGGTSQRRITAFVLLHLMNHATHHRGQIAEILDEAGIEHDFSGVLQSMRQRGESG